MKISFKFEWYKKPKPPPIPDNECKHDWANWTNTVEVEVTQPTLLGGYRDKVTLSQSRTCLKCNMQERRYL